MIVSISQPAYMPWLGYFDRIDASDVHVVLDHVQFEKNSFVNRNKFRTVTGWSWLTIPLATKGKFGSLAIDRLSVADGGRWSHKHLNAIRSNYARASRFSDHEAFLEDFYGRAANSERFLPPVLELSEYFRDTLGIATRILRSSQMKTSASKSELVLDLCRQVGATTYISGSLGRDYLELERFSAAKIEVVFHDYEPQKYAQAWPDFEPGMAVIDVLANHDAVAATDIMRSGRRLAPR